MILIFIFIFGLFFGSFLGVAVDRIQRNETIIKGRSHCDKCKKELGLLDLMPVLSFVFLKGKCRFCGVKLSFFYPIIEISTGILFILTYVFVISNFKFLISNQIQNPNSLIINPLLLIPFLYYLFIVSSFIVIFFTDLKYGIIPDKIVVPAVVIAFGWLMVNGSWFMVNHLLSAAGAFLFFVVISYLFYILSKKQGMGGGDIKLSFLLGLFLGYPGILVSLYLAFLTGAIIAIILILWKKKSTLKDTLPFGPFLISGAIISLFWGNYIYSFALNLLGI